MKHRRVECCSKRRRTVSLTNRVTNGNFASTTGWTSSGASFTVSGNEASFLANSASDTLQQAQSFTNGHKYYIAGWVKATAGANITVGLSDGLVNSISAAYAGGGNYEYLSGILTAGRDTTGGGILWALVDNLASGWTTDNAKYYSVIDLTAAFGAGNEPTKAQMDDLMNQFANKWLNGTQSAEYFW